jgi:uracil-DNA glycosylase
MRSPRPTPEIPIPLAAVRRNVTSCTRCPRLREYCARIARVKKRAHAAETYWGRPVPGFGDSRARLLVLGLAPAAHGANRTGRVFTGDGSGGFLMRAMYDTGFASLPTSEHAADGLTLRDAYIAAAVRCAPPGNKPSPEEAARRGRARTHRVRCRARPPGPGGIALRRPAAVFAWRRVSGAGRAAARGFLSSEPAEHEHRPADGRHAAGRVRARAGMPHHGGRVPDYTAGIRRTQCSEELMAGWCWRSSSPGRR